MLYNKLKHHPPEKMAEPEIDMQNGHNHCRGSGKYGRWAAFGCGVSLIPEKLTMSL